MNKRPGSNSLLHICLSSMSTAVPQVQEAETPLSDAEVDVRLSVYFAWQYLRRAQSITLLLGSFRFCVASTKKRANT